MSTQENNGALAAEGNAVRSSTALLALGGDVRREHYAIALAESQEFRNCTLYLSSGILDSSYLGLQRLGPRAVTDRSAVDTVANFTTLLPYIRKAKQTEIVCVTSASHLRRAGIIGRIILGSQGIRLRMRSVPGTENEESESIFRVARDALRAVLWTLTGFTGESVALWWHPDRIHHIKWRRRVARE